MMLATQSTAVTSEFLPPSGDNGIAPPVLKEFDFSDLDVIRGLDSTNDKAVVIKSSRHLNKNSTSPNSISNQQKDSSQNAKSIKRTTSLGLISTASNKKNVRDVKMFRPLWPDDEPRLPGTNLSFVRRLDAAVKAANALPKRGIVRQDSVIPRRKSASNNDRVFMKVGNNVDRPHSDGSDDDVGPLLDQSSSTRKLRKRFSLLSQRKGSDETGGAVFGVGRMGRRNSRRISRFLNLQGLDTSNPDVQGQEEEDEQIKREIRADIRKKFRAAGFMAIFSARLAMAYVRTTTEKDISPFVKQINFKEEHSKSDILDDSPYGFDPTRFKANRDMRISEETKRILKKPPWTRTTREVYHVEVLLRDIKAYADYPVGMQKKIAEVGQYRKYDAKRVIVREGHVANNFYFILSGAVVVMVMDEQRKYAKPVANLHRGDSFGELAIIHSKRRQSTVVAKEKVEMLAIWFEDYLDIFMAGGVKNIYDPDHNDFISNVSILKHWPLKMIEGNESKFVFHFYKRGEIVVKDSNCSKWIIIVKSGSLSVMKKLKRCEAFEWIKKPEKRAKTRKTRRQKQKEINSRSIMRRIILPDLNIELKTPDDSLKVKFNDESSDDGDDQYEEEEENNNDINDDDRYHSMDSLQSVETSDSLRTVIRPRKAPEVIEENDDETAAAVEFKQEIRTLASDYDNNYRRKDPDEYTAADLDPQFVNVQRLTKGMQFGVAEFVFDTQPSLCVISNGAECILFDKQFYLEHAPQQCMTLIRKEVCPFPTDEEMQVGLQTCIDWEAFKSVTMKDTVQEIKGRKTQFKDNAIHRPHTLKQNIMKLVK